METAVGRIKICPAVLNKLQQLPWQGSYTLGKTVRHELWCGPRPWILVLFFSDFASISFDCRCQIWPWRVCTLKNIVVQRRNLKTQHIANLLWVLNRRSRCLRKNSLYSDTNYHIGNSRFRYFVSRYKDQYQAASREARSSIVIEIIDEWRNQEPPGRFVTRTDPANREHSTWHDVGDEVCTICGTVQFPLLCCIVCLQLPHTNAIFVLRVYNRPPSKKQWRC